MASWEDEDLSTPAVVATVAADNWEGEDEEDIADDWDAEEKPEKEDTPPPQPTTQKKKRNIKDIIAEKEQKKKEEIEKKRAEQEKVEDNESESLPKTELERQKLAEEAELSLLQDTFGPSVPDILIENSIDHFDPSSKDDFDKLLNLMKTKLLKYEKSPHYTIFLENLFRELTVETDTDFLRKMGTMFSALANEKLKLQKSSKTKKKSSKGKIAVVRANDFDDFDENAVYDEFDDF